MKRKDKTGSEIEPWEMKEPRKKPAGASDKADLKTKKISRKSFRGPVAESDAAEVQINDQRFSVIDIGNRGVGIALPEPDSLSTGETYTITLILHGKSFTLEGRVKHISPSASGHYLAGIELLNLDEEAEQKLQTFLQRKRAQMFGFMGK